MNGQGSQSQRNVVNGAVRGAFRSVRLGWTDAVSGERLLVETSGDSSYFRALEAQGFERLPDSAPTPLGPRLAHASARAGSVRARPTRGTAVG
ncbi:MAG TPA: hypothetical protein VMT18_00135 [Planctomycetota bacterium]|nr:hypothetical protein [Planctomycetota bacterium]